jgi:hypothetical protein
MRSSRREKSAAPPRHHTILTSDTYGESSGRRGGSRSCRPAFIQSGHTKARRARTSWCVSVPWLSTPSSRACWSRMRRKAATAWSMAAVVAVEHGGVGGVEHGGVEHGGSGDEGHKGRVEHGGVV